MANAARRTRDVCNRKFDADGVLRREWVRVPQPYQDPVVFSGEEPGYCGKCTKSSKAIDFFDELFGDAAAFIKRVTNNNIRLKKSDVVSDLPTRIEETAVAVSDAEVTETPTRIEETAVAVSDAEVTDTPTRSKRTAHVAFDDEAGPSQPDTSVRMVTVADPLLNGRRMKRCTVMVSSIDKGLADAELERVMERAAQRQRLETVEKSVPESVPKKASRTKPKQLPITIGEVYAFLGANIVMGYNRQPELDNYWSTATDLGCAAIKSVMSRERFNHLSKFLRYMAQPSLRPGDVGYDDQKAAEKIDPVMKVRPLMEYWNRRFCEARNPSEHLAVDETMTAFQGRSKFKICQPNKPIKWGFEHYTLCDAKNGYILNDEAHVPKRPNVEQEVLFQEMPRSVNEMGKQTVWLLRNYLNKGYTVACDNRFTSANLFDWLYEVKGTYGVGTLRQNSAEMPADYKDLCKFKGKGRGDYCLQQNGRLLLTVWRDTTTVCILSTGVDPTAEPGKVKRRIGGEKREVACPAAALEYTLNFNGVDIANHLSHSNKVGRRSVLWHRYFFFHKLNQILVNAHINYLEVHGLTRKEVRSQLPFRRAVAMKLLERGVKTDNRRVAPPVQQQPRIGHRLAKADRSRRCAVCVNHHGKRHDSSFWCAVCKVNVCKPESKRDCYQLHKSGVGAPVFKRRTEK